MNLIKKTAAIILSAAICMSVCLVGFTASATDGAVSEGEVISPVDPDENETPETPAEPEVPVEEEIIFPDPVGISVAVNKEFVYMGEDFWYDTYDWEQYAEITYNYSDGTSKTESLRFAEYTTDMDQYENPWKIGVNYFNVYAYGFEAEVAVNVVESGITSISAVATKEAVEGVDSWYKCEEDEATGDMRVWNVYEAWSFKPTLTITRGDKVETLTYDEYCYSLSSVLFDESYEGRLTVGEQTVNATYMGVPFTFDVVIKENPIESLELTLDPVTEGDEGGYFGAIYSEDSEEVTYGYTYLPFHNPGAYNPTYTITYKDDREPEVITINDEQFYNYFWNTGFNLYGAPEITGVGTYKLSFICNGIVGETELTVLPNSITEFYVEVGSAAYEVLDSCTLYQPSQYDDIPYTGYDMSKFDLTFCYRREGDDSLYSVTYDELINMGDYFEILGQSYYTPLKVGKNTLYASYQGKMCSFEVEILPNPVEKVNVVAMGSLKEGVNSTVSYTYFAGQTYAYYDYNLADFDIMVSISFTSESGLSRKTFIYKSEDAYTDADIELLNPISHKNPLVVGTNTVKATYLGKEIELDLEIEQSDTVEKIVITPTANIVEKQNCENRYDGEYNSEYKYYYEDAFAPTLTVYYTNGDVGVFDWNSINSQGLGLNIRQGATDQLKVGTNIVYAEAFGKFCRFKLVMEENPIRSIEIKQSAPAIEYEGGYYSTYDRGDRVDTIYHYDNDALNLEYTVSYSDGRVETYYKQHDLYQATGQQAYYNQSYVAMELGTHTYDFSLNDEIYPVEITIEKSSNPVVSVTAKPTGVLFDFDSWDNGSYTHYSSEQLDILLEATYLDGTTELVNQNEMNNDVYVVQNRFNTFAVGENTATVLYKGASCQIDFEIFKSEDVLEEGSFSYVINSDGTATIVSIASGSYEELTIPTTLGGKTVKNVASVRNIHDGWTPEIYNLTVPDGVEIYNALNMINCLNTLTIGDTFNDTVKKIVYNSYDIRTINLTAPNDKYLSVDGALYSLDGKTLHFASIDEYGNFEVPEAVTTIASESFNRFWRGSVTIPSTVTEIADDCGMVRYYNEEDFDIKVGRIYCDEGSAAEQFAIKYDISRARIPCKHIYGDYTMVYENPDAPFCQKYGYLRKLCTLCGEQDWNASDIWVTNIGCQNEKTVTWGEGCYSSVMVERRCIYCNDGWTDEQYTYYHTYNPWKWIIEPNGDTPGIKQRVCRSCYNPETGEGVETVQGFALDNYGDINGDGEYDVRDLIRLKKDLANNKPYDKLSDLDGENGVNSADLALLGKFLVGDMRRFPVECNF